MACQPNAPDVAYIVTNQIVSYGESSAHEIHAVSDKPVVRVAQLAMMAADGGMPQFAHLGFWPMHITAQQIAKTLEPLTPFDVCFSLEPKFPSVSERLRTGAESDAQFDTWYEKGGFGPIRRVRWEIARLCAGYRSVPTDDQLFTALRALKDHVPPPVPDFEDNDDDDTVPPAPTLVERLAYLVDLGSGPQSPAVSVRRARLITEAMEAVTGGDGSDHAGAGARQTARGESASTGPLGSGAWNPLGRLYELLEEAKLTGKGEQLYTAPLLLGALNDGQFFDFIGAVKKGVAESKAGLHIDINALKRERRRAHEKQAVYVRAEEARAATARTGKPVIIISNRQLSDLRDEAIAKLQEKNDPPIVFQRLRELARRRTDALGEPFLEAMTDMSLRGRLSDVASFFVEGGNGALVAAFPPRALCEDILAYPHQPGTFPVVEGITRSPVVRADGTICAKPGFDPETRLIYNPPPGFMLPPVPENPTREEIETAKQVLLDVVRDFPFEEPADKTNFVGFCLTPVIRPQVDVVPMAVIDSPVSGSGKGLLTDTASIITIGEVAAVIPPPAAREEWPKLLSSLLDSGRTFICFDNLHDVLRSDALEAVLTKPFLQFRQLGHTRERIVPNRAVWCITGNNVAVSRDMVRRCFRIRIDPRCAQPHLRKQFKHPNLVAYCKSERGNLLAALLVLVRAWYAAGKPEFGGTALGTYTAWKEIVGGILKHAGLDDFLANQRALYTAMDLESEEWEAFFLQIEERFGGEDFSASQLVSKIHSRAISNLPREVAKIYGQSTSHKESRPNPYFAVQLGHILRARKGTRFGTSEVYLERSTEDPHKKVALYRVRRGMSI